MIERIRAFLGLTRPLIVPVVDSCVGCKGQWPVGSTTAQYAQPIPRTVYLERHPIGEVWIEGQRHIKYCEGSEEPEG